MRLPILQLVLQEVFQREVNDALILTGIHEGSHGNHVFRIVVVNLLQVTKLPLESGLLGDKVGCLHIDCVVAFCCHKINLCRIHLSYGDFVAQPYKMLVNQNNEVLQSVQYFFFFAFVNLYKGNVFVDYTKQNRKKKAFRSLQ